MFTWIFGSILVPTWLHFTLPNPPKSFKKSDPKSHQNFDRFLLRFFLDSGSVLGSKLEPCWPPFSSQDALRRPKDGQKTPQDAPKTAKDTPRRPKTPPRRPQGAQNPPQTTILEGFGPSGPRFWTLQTSIFQILGRFLEDFWTYNV